MSETTDATDRMEAVEKAIEELEEAAEVVGELDVIGTHRVDALDRKRAQENREAARSALLSLVREAVQDSALLGFIRRECRVVYVPPDGGYPIEHAPHARKDSWHLLTTARASSGFYRSDTYCTPDTCDCSDPGHHRSGRA